MINEKKNWIVCFMLLFGTAIRAATIQVPRDQASIQEAINHAQNGDTILVAPGTYYENINFKGKNIVVASHFALDGNPDYIKSTVIDGSRPVQPDTTSTVIFANGEDSTASIVGFTITGGGGTRYFYPNNFLCREGGGVYIERSSPTIKNNLIMNNNLYGSGGVNELGGGGVRSNLGYPHIINNIITGNSAQYGAAFVIDNSAFDMAYLSRSGGEIKNNLIFENSGATKYGGGGAFWISFPAHSPIQLENNTIVNNSAAGAGGIFVVSSKVTIKNNILWGNTAEQISVSNSFGQSIVDVLYNEIQGGYEGQGVGVGNLDIYPRFKNAYLLSDGSPCIDAGDPDTQDNDREDPSHSGSALYPSGGGLRNDMGMYGGTYAWLGMTAFLPSAYAYFTSPGNQMVFQYPDSILISAEVVNLDNISSVEYYRNNKKIAELHEAPFKCYWIPDTTSEITLTMRAIGSKDTIQPLFPAQIGMVKANYKVTASSYQSFVTGPWNAVDGKSITRWTSLASNTQWICIDLGKVESVSGVTLSWQTSYGQEYQIQVSSDTLTWNDVYSTATGNGGVDAIAFDRVQARYVQMLGTQRASSTGGYSLYEFLVHADETDAVRETEMGRMPNGFELDQNYPNPFNPTTTISYSIPKESFVSLTIHDMLGRKVKTVVNDNREAGRHQIEYDGRSLSSGIYFLKLTAAGLVDLKKITLIK